MYRHDNIPIKGWPAVVLAVEDDSTRWMKDQGKTIQVIGHIRLHPEWDCDYVQFDGVKENLSLDAYFRCSKDKLPNILLEAGEGTRIIVTGDIGERNWKEKYPDLETILWLDEFIMDSTGGKSAPTSARLSVADKEEYSRVANLRNAQK